MLALILSIFNVINLLATNNNNNNNRNNINDNLGNVNAGDNSESNANSNGMTATQVMLVPPGVGKRYGIQQILFKKNVKNSSKKINRWH